MSIFNMKTINIHIELLKEILQHDKNFSQKTKRDQDLRIMGRIKMSFFLFFNFFLT
jgi:hypothetical protein